MPSHTKPSGPNRQVSKNRAGNEIMKLSRQQLAITQAHYKCPAVNQVNHLDKQFPSKKIKTGQPSVEIDNNLVTNSVSKSNLLRVTTSKGMKQPDIPEKQKPPPRSMVNERIRLKESRALKGKGDDNDASQPTYLKAMPGLVSKKTGILGQYSDLSSSELKQRESSDKQEGIARAKYRTMELEKHTLDYTSSDIHCNSGSISSYQFGSDVQRDIHFVNLTFENVEKRGFVDRNMGHCNSMSQKRKEPLSQENPNALDDNDCSVGVRGHNLSSNLTKKLRQSTETRKDEAEDGVVDLNHVGVGDATASIQNNDHAKVVVSSRFERQCSSCLKPIDKPCWSGIFKIGNKEYVSLDGHLSTKSCEKAWSLSRQLIKIVEVKKVSRLEVWPKAWEVSTPTGDDIGIFFFPHEMRQDEALHQLVREVMENDLAFQAIIGEAEMLIFPSILLPIHHQTFQGKHYLWGVFKRREDKGVVIKEPLNSMGRCEKEKQQKVVADQSNLSVEKLNQKMSQVAGAIPLPANERTQEEKGSRLIGPTNNEGFDLKVIGEEWGHAEGAFVATDAASFLASNGHITSRMGPTQGRVMGFFVRKTPKIDQIIQAMEQEGALVFAMQGKMVGAGSWAGSNAPATQK